MELTERIKRFLDEFGVSLTAFARKNGKSRQLFYMWLTGRNAPSEKTQKEVDAYLKKYGF